MPCFLSVECLGLKKRKNLLSGQHKPETQEREQVRYRAEAVPSLTRLVLTRVTQGEWSSWLFSAPCARSEVKG